MWRTSKGVYHWTDETWNEVRPLMNQKTLEDSSLDTKNPDAPVMTLDPQLSANAFINMLVLLGKM
jgi:hypothetical protein